MQGGKTLAIGCEGDGFLASNLSVLDTLPALGILPAVVAGNLFVVMHLWH